MISVYLLLDFIPIPLLFRFPRKKHAFLFCFVSDLCYLCSINQYTQLFAVSKIYADESTHSKYK